jgi:predicted enzyme related to lactoylglutathione lyase
LEGLGEAYMKRVTGIGGIFFKTKDPDKLRQWYSAHLGIITDQYGANFNWRKPDGARGYTVWSTFKDDTKYFLPGEKELMINYRVENLKELLKVLKEEGVTIVGEMEVYEYGKFGWILDPEGNKIELWEPVDSEFDKLYSNEHSNTSS